MRSCPVSNIWHTQVLSPINSFWSLNDRPRLLLHHENHMRPAPAMKPRRTLRRIFGEEGVWGTLCFIQGQHSDCLGHSNDLFSCYILKAIGNTSRFFWSVLSRDRKRDTSICWHRHWSFSSTTQQSYRVSLSMASWLKTFLRKNDLSR